MLTIEDAIRIDKIGLSENEKPWKRMVSSLSLIYVNQDRFLAYFDKSLATARDEGVYYSFNEKEQLEVFMKRCGLKFDRIPKLMEICNMFFESQFSDLKRHMKNHYVIELAFVARQIRRQREVENLDSETVEALSAREKHRLRAVAYRKSQRDAIADELAEVERLKKLASKAKRIDSLETDITRLEKKLQGHIDRLNEEIEKFKTKYEPEIQERKQQLEKEMTDEE